MSGHSKWSTIKRQKAVTDSKRSAIFTKLAKGIAIAVKKGGQDPEMNFTLRLAIQKAREANMPSDNIERAIKRGSGENEKELSSVLYEGYGPEGIAVLIEAVTDNKNRTTADLRSLLTKAGGSLGTTNTVAWQFEQSGVIRIPSEELQKTNKDELELSLIDAGALDVREETEGLTILTKREDMFRIIAACEKAGLRPATTGLEYIPKTTVPVTHNDAVQTLIETLENHDDVENVYTNAQIKT